MAADMSLLPRAEDLDDLLERDRDDVLSVALATDPTTPENQAVRPAYLIWLENALRDLLRDRGLRERLGRAARATVAEGYSLAATARALLRLYTTLIAGGNAQEAAPALTNHPGESETSREFDRHRQGV